jgi:hypothetical protein
MFRYTDEPRHPHPSDRLDTLNDWMIVLAVVSGAFALLGVLFFAGRL